MSEENQLNDDQKEIARLVAYTLLGNEEAQKTLTSQVLPIMQSEESGYESLAEFIRLFIIREMSELEMAGLFQRLDDIEQAIVILAMQIHEQN